MPKDESAPTVFQENLRRLAGESVNAWAKKHNLEQTTVNRIVSGQSDPKLSMILKIAEAIGLEPWQLLTPGLQADNPPVIQGTAGETERRLWGRIEELLNEIKGLHERKGVSPPPAQKAPSRLPEPFHERRVQNLPVRHERRQELTNPWRTSESISNKKDFNK